MRDDLVVKLRNGRRTACKTHCHDIRSYPYHVGSGYLGYERYRTGCSRICLDDIYDAVLDRVLHIHETDNVHLDCDLPCVFLDGGNLLVSKVQRRQDARRVTGVDTCKLDVLHDSWNIAVGAVRDRICLTLSSVVQETVDEDRSVGCNADCRIHIDSEHLVVVNDFHSSSAEDEGRTYHDGVADLACDGDGLVCIDCHTCLRHGDAQTLHHCPEVVTVLSEVDGLRSSTEDIDAVGLEGSCEVQRSLSAELRDNADRLLLLIDGKNVLECERLEVELVRSIVVCRYRLRVAVYYDGLEAELLECERSMYAAVVELDSLSDPVRAAAQDHDLLVLGRRRLILSDVVGRIVISSILCAGYMNAFPCFLDAELITCLTDEIFGYA